MAGVLVLVLALSGCATWQDTHKLYAEECFGIWVNGSYNSEEKRAAKIIYHPDMTWAAYKTDSIDIIVYELWKINKSATIIEGTWGAEYIPREIDPASESYTKYYRFSSTGNNVNPGRHINM